ncbi:MAG: hypothetical protein IJ903_03085 [Ruminococcus sp.]|nr:hypothetical protein [Ruminococcus sp.]
MKTKAKRLSKRSLAIFLGVLMLVTSLGIGSMITASAWYDLQTGARFYFNANGSGFSGTYYYCAFIWNDWKNYSIIQMQHIANTDLYTCVTTSDNISTRGDPQGVCFFSSNSGSWATKDKYLSGGAHNDIKTYCGKGYTEVYEGAVNNNHVYYYHSTGSNNITRDNDYDWGDALANHANVTELKAGQQKASVYTSTTSANPTSGYTFDSTGTLGGKVEVGGYGWATAFTTTAKSFAEDSSQSGHLGYSFFDVPVLTSEITMRVKEVYDGYVFKGWYDGSEQKSTSTTYTYKLTGNSTKDIKACFYKPTYITETPITTSGTISEGTILVNKGSNSNTPKGMWLWNCMPDSRRALTKIGTTKIYKYTNSQITSSNYPKAIIFSTTNTSSFNAETTWPGDNGKLTGDITKSGTNSTNIFYYTLDNTSATNWTNFEHLGVNAPTVSPASVDNVGAEVSLSTTLSGTLKDASKVKFYYTKNPDAATPTYYLISSGSTSTTFYPPSKGKYKFIATATDSEGIESVRSSQSSYLTVGSVGYYVTGTHELIGNSSDWAETPSRGEMTNSSGTIWTKTFSNVPAGTHEFRIQNFDGYVGEADADYTITGNADATAGGSENNNVVFTLTGKSKVVITFDSEKVNNKYPVTVNVYEVSSIPVTVYCNSHGTVQVTYGSAVTTITPADKKKTIQVAEGEEIDLLAEPDEGYTFNKWVKNLANPYQIESVNAGASIANEEITKKTVYTACFTSGGGSIDYDTTGWSDVSSTYTVKYLIGNDSEYTSAVPSGLDTIEGRVYQSGSKWFVTFSSTDVTAWKAIGNSNIRFNLFQNTTAHFGNSKTVGLADGSSGITFDSTTKERDGKYHICVNSVSSSVNAIGILFNDSPGSGEKNITFYTSTSSGGDSDDDYIPITNYYAKDSTIRDGNKLTYIGAVDTTVTPVADQISVDESEGKNWEAGYACKGSKITVTTTIPTTGSLTATNSSGSNVTVTPAQKYYVKGFSFNGITPELLEERNDGVYTCTYTIPEDMPENMLEITPIYYIREAYAGNTATFYINGYDKKIKENGWGNTLFIYPYYKYYKSGSSDPKTTYEGQAENVGKYPGTPLINYRGQLFAQIPLTCDGTTNGPDTNGNPIKGITINNGFNDTVHKSYCNFVSDHKQTYDYDDFQKIAKEKASGLHSIYFSFKYFEQDTSNQHRLYSYTNSAGSKSRRNDTIVSDTRLSMSGTVSNDTMTSYPGANNQWEDLTNALGDKVDLFGNKATKTTDYPIRVVSMGYEYNNSGEYATEWAVYYWNGSNYTLAYDSTNNMGTGKNLNSSIVPSALIMNSSSSFSNYTAMDADLGINGYNKLYTVLEDYKGYPVKICYEHEAPIAYNSPPAYRCDGRWTYTTDSDYVQSNIVIEYKGKNASSYVEESSYDDTHVGHNSKCKAYFTNSSFYGEMTSETEIISNTEKLTFEAETAGSYQFRGWYLQDTNGKESTITETDLESETLRSGNFKIIARFEYVAEGTLTVSHNLATGQSGRANTYLGLTLINGGQETVVKNVSSNTDSYTFDSSVINSSSNYSIRIEVRTVPIGENAFDEYTCYTTDTSGATDVRSKVTSANNFYDPANAEHATVDTYTINVKSDLYNNTTTQSVSVVEYISSLNTVKYNYSIKYNYTSRSFGNQSYTKTGSLTAAQIGDTSIVTGTENTADKRLTTAFLTKITPHESDFNKNTTWNYSGTQNCIYTSGTNTYTIYLDGTNSSGTVTGTSTDDIVRHGYFSVPYELDTSGSKNGIASTTITGGDEYGTYVADNNTFTVDTRFEGDFTDSDGKLVTAPKKIYDDDDGVYKFFQYWSINTVSGKKGTSKEVAKCFFNEMNYIAYEDYNIEAIYGAQANFGDLYNASEGTTISFLCNTRNQWNGNGYGTADNHLVSGDIVYNDFIVSFKPLGADLIRDISGAETGIIIQQLGEVETKSGKNAKTLAEYADGYSESELTAAKNAATSFVNGTTTAGFTQKKRTISLANINNKNRSHYAFTAYSKYTRDTDLNGTIDVDYVNNGVNYLYRAYSYMKYTYQGSTRIVVSETPTYYTMYDIATE